MPKPLYGECRLLTVTGNQKPDTQPNWQVARRYLQAAAENDAKYSSFTKYFRDDSAIKVTFIFVGILVVGVAHGTVFLNCSTCRIVLLNTMLWTRMCFHWDYLTLFQHFILTKWQVHLKVLTGLQ